MQVKYWEVVAIVVADEQESEILGGKGLACTEEQEHFATINIVLKLLSVYVVGW